MSCYEFIICSIQEVKENQEVTQARRAADAASKKSLYEQLAEQQDKKKEEYDANTKLIFGEMAKTNIMSIILPVNFLHYLAPPKCLDEEDVEYFSEVDKRHKAFLDNQKKQDEKKLEEFRKKSQHSDQQQPLIKFQQKKENSKMSALPIGMRIITVIDLLFNI